MSSMPQATPAKDTAPGVTVNNQPSNPFDSLPIETLQNIASLIEDDPDLRNFQAICRSTRAAVDGDNFSLWRRRFVSVFEPTGWAQAENFKYKTEYRRRRRVLHHGANFREGRSREEMECLKVLRELMLEAFADSKTQGQQSRNFTHLIKFLQDTNILKTIFRPTPLKSTRYSATLTTKPLQADPLLHTLRVLCTPLLLSLDSNLVHAGHYSFPDSQAAVYSPANTHPFFGGRCGLDINMELVLHHVNFWRYHMVREAEQTLFTACSELSEGESVQWWDSQLKQGDKTLGKYWKGSYAYLDHDDLALMREGVRSGGDDDSGPYNFQDIFAGEDAAFAFQDMELSLLPDGQKMTWPDAFERHLRSLTLPPPSSPTSNIRTRAQKRSDAAGGTPEEITAIKPLSFRFDGNGEDSAESFLASGWLNPLPSQHGIPGWRRLTMMKYFDLDENNDVSANIDGVNIDFDALWAYEGVVLPGGKVVLGRWWSPGSSMGEGGELYSGPFVLWCVDGAEGYEVAEGT